MDTVDYPVSLYEDRLANTAELAYLESLRKCLAAKKVQNRTSVPARMIPHATLEFDLREGVFPLLTTKKMALRSIFYELMWFLRGDQDTAWLREKGVHIWDGNTSRGALDAAGLADKQPGYVGPSYGSQWRSTGSRGLDQLAGVVVGLAEDPHSRRHLVVAWNPVDLPHMALPPCHYSFQFIVEEIDSTPSLSCAVTMRSADAPLGVPFNIASYALLTRIVADILGYESSRLFLSCSCYHIYEIHEAAVAEQLCRQPRPFPRLSLAKNLRGVAIGDVPGQLEFSDLILEGYDSHPRIPMGMVA